MCSNVLNEKNIIINGQSFLAFFFLVIIACTNVGCFFLKEVQTSQKQNQIK